MIGRCMARAYTTFTNVCASKDVRDDILKIIPNKRLRTVNIKVGRRILQVFKLSDPDATGHCHLVQDIDESSMIPQWLGKDLLAAVVAAYNAKE